LSHGAAGQCSCCGAHADTGVSDGVAARFDYDAIEMGNGRGRLMGATALRMMLMFLSKLVSLLLLCGGDARCL
jgi:hypothetical protein